MLILIMNVFSFFYSSHVNYSALIIISFFLLLLLHFLLCFMSTPSAAGMQKMKGGVEIS